MCNTLSGLTWIPDLTPNAEKAWRQTDLKGLPRNQHPLLEKGNHTYM